ncbi:unnamed protein product [Candidula unifasciata]|uniref:Fibronectin type-III domain-containing protein n=1 Tax=Candidula unifasciata TaxID=100452 RepID=A0A8S3ZD76_9EUPU|nr:unnamed protein product [Candidula unifasciata]
MYLPAATISATMATEPTDGGALKLSPEVSSTTATSVYIKWAWEGLGPVHVRGFRVHYHRLSSSYVQHSVLLPPSASSYGIGNLVADTYYKVCVTMYYNDTSIPLKECVDASTTSWHIPVSIGSSIGAVLALSIIVFIILLARCPGLARQPRTAAAESSKYDSIDTTTYCHDRDDDVFSQHSEGDSLTDSKTLSRQNHHHHYHNHNHYSPQSLAERLYTGTRMVNGVTKPMPLGSVGRTLSLTDRRHHPNNAHKSRQARLAHLHANFHSIQSEPGSTKSRPSPRISITDLPVSSVSADFPSGRKTHSSASSTNVNNNRVTVSRTSCYRPTGFRENPRLMYRIESANSTSEPSMDVKNNEPKRKPPALKNLPKTLHMSIDGDTLV